jgi:hypothetical protein
MVGEKTTKARDFPVQALGQSRCGQKDPSPSPAEKVSGQKVSGLVMHGLGRLSFQELVGRWPMGKGKERVSSWWAARTSGVVL